MVTPRAALRLPVCNNELRIGPRKITSAGETCQRSDADAFDASNPLTNDL